MSAVEAQAKLNQYYAQNAAQYDDIHVKMGDPHYVALERTLELVRGRGIQSVLDVGCGTGRALAWYQANIPGIAVAGVDPSAEMLDLAAQRARGALCKQGLAQSLPFEDRAFDLVVATGIMHHVDDPEACIRQMLRVARKAILISDHNNYAFRGQLGQRVRIGLRATGLLDLATFIKQGFRRQGYSEDDGYWYPFSIFDHYRTIALAAKRVQLVPTCRPSGIDGNLLFCQSHIAIWAEME